MASRAISSFTTKPALPQLHHGTTSPAGSLRFPQQRKLAMRSVVVAGETAGSMTGVIFEPFEEV
ncbi:hypothetical protein ISN44_As08g009660 [Arabidopsis suecica]|uniref:Uncharacterized protein n=1 Tax=Arabidopsis suecica TaxID=45249 RepID=A0A8T2B4Z3_ARASU|nr:hypothetical protein ISN44_As08g009660 [Arabidopsis suecica]KAG7581252.1 hypothetical protein ISN44_As08g009660 [Arabidopsis suecica]KAG7581253.1 hypothetical protein ISN44_As08g009660 [Arabidopsis suecica]